jgi:hypothetical protein
VAVAGDQHPEPRAFLVEHFEDGICLRLRERVGRARRTRLDGDIAAEHPHHHEFRGRNRREGQQARRRDQRRRHIAQDHALISCGAGTWAAPTGLTKQRSCQLEQRKLSAGSRVAAPDSRIAIAKM